MAHANKCFRHGYREGALSLLIKARYLVDFCANLPPEELRLSPEESVRLLQLQAHTLKNWSRYFSNGDQLEYQLTETLQHLASTLAIEYRKVSWLPLTAADSWWEGSGNDPEGDSEERRLAIASLHLHISQLLAQLRQDAFSLEHALHSVRGLQQLLLLGDGMTIALNPFSPLSDKRHGDGATSVGANGWEPSALVQDPQPGPPMESSLPPQHSIQERLHKHEAADRRQYKERSISLLASAMHRVGLQESVLQRHAAAAHAQLSAYEFAALHFGLAHVKTRQLQLSYEQARGECADPSSFPAISKEALLGIGRERKQFQKEVKDWNTRYAVRQRDREAPALAPWVRDKTAKKGEVAWHQQQAAELPRYHRQFDSNTHKQKFRRSQESERMLYWYEYEEQQKALQGETAAVFAHHPMIGGQHDPYVCGFEMKKVPTMRNRGFLLKQEGQKGAETKEWQGKTGTARERHSRRLYEEIDGAKSWWGVNKRLPTGVPMKLPPKAFIGNGEGATLLKNLAIGKQRYKQKAVTSGATTSRFRLRKKEPNSASGCRYQDDELTELSIYEDLGGGDSGDDDDERSNFFYDSSDEEAELEEQAAVAAVECPTGADARTKWELFENIDLVVRKGGPRRQFLADRLTLGCQDDADEGDANTIDGESGYAQPNGSSSGDGGSLGSMATESTMGNMLNGAEVQQVRGRRRSITAASVREGGVQIMRPTPPMATIPNRSRGGGSTRERRGSLHMASAGVGSKSYVGETSAANMLAGQTCGNARMGIEYFEVRIGLLDKASGKPYRASGLVMFVLGAEATPYDRPPPIRTGQDGFVGIWLRRGVYRLSVCHGAGASTSGRVHQIYVDRRSAQKKAGATVTYFVGAADVIKHDRLVRDLRARILQRFFREEFLYQGTTAHARLWLAPRLQAVWRGNMQRQWLQLAHAAASTVQDAAKQRLERKEARSRVAELRKEALRANAERLKKEMKQNAAAAMAQRYGTWQVWVHKLTLVHGDTGERTVRQWQPYLLALGVSGMHLNFFKDKSKNKMSAPVIDLRKICSVDKQPEEPGPENATSQVFHLVVGQKYAKSYSLSLVGNNSEDIMLTAKAIQTLRCMSEDARQAAKTGHLDT
jgi:hypothetical protein